jgi:DNA-binding LacI/PurR family transcriptional regulator
MAPGIDRLKGYRDALADVSLAHDPTLEATSDFSREGGAEAMRRLLEARPDLDAVFAASDFIAAGALSVLRAAGRTVPGNVAVVGYDDSPWAEAVDPPLTSVRQPIDEMGAELVQLLVACIEDPRRPARHVLLSTELIRRGSSAGRPSP